jgi:C4-type Zn-finger protein
MEQEDTVSPQLWRALDGYDIESGFGRTCPSCKQEYEAGDRLVVCTERPPSTSEWSISSIVCRECGQRSLSDDERRSSVEQTLVSAELTVAAMTLVLDGETARLLDRSPAIET